MVLGHSAAAAAEQCINRDIAVQDADMDDLRDTLVKEKQVLWLPKKR